MAEGTVCLAVLNNEEMKNENSLRVESKRDHICELGNNLELPSKKQARETSNDDIFSEVSNPSVSSWGLASSVHINSSQVAEPVSGDQIGCGEISSTCSKNSSSDSLSEEDGSRNASGAVSTSQITLEIPKHARSSGIRKITFKFCKSKDEYYNQLSPSLSHPGKNGAHDDLFCRGSDEEPGTSSALSCAPSMELKMSKKVVLDNYPTNVKKLLSTGILEGARVKYISPTREKELCGIISGCGYLCGCLACNFSKVLSAYEFELHAGGKTRHPNNHIYLENGRPIYSIIQELRITPLNELDEVIKDMAGSSVNKEFFKIWRASFQQNTVVEVDKRCQIMPPSSPHSRVSCPSEAIEYGICPTACYFVPNILLKEQAYMKTSVGRKRAAKKPNSYPSKALSQKKASEGSTKKRDNDLHRLLFLPNGLQDGAELAYCTKGQRVLGGYKQGNGIVCSHCNVKISPSQFEAHAGWAARRQPYRHIYAANGYTLHDLAILLSNGQSLATGNSDDMCSVCGDGGSLILCHGCPRAFHAACLELQCAPESNWHCDHCKEKYGSGKTAKPISVRLVRTDEPESEYASCAVCGSDNFIPVIFCDQTVIICDQCEREFHVSCLRETGRCDLQELPKDDWFCTDDCRRIRLALHKIVPKGAEMIPDSALSTIIRKHADKGLTFGEVNDIQWQILHGKGRHLEHLPLLSKATAIFRETFSPIVMASGRDLLPLMVYGRNISGQEFGGMYCVVLIVKSVVVSACLLRILGRDAAELPLAATSDKNQGKGYFQALFSCIEGLLYSLNVEKLMLPATDEAQSIWTNKFGFRKMSEEQLSKYKKQFQLTLFGGSLVLEKELRG